MATMAQQERVSVSVPPRRRRDFTWSALLWVAPTVILIAVFFIWPMIITIITSFESTDNLGNVTGFAGLKWYRNIFTDPNNLIVLRNNVLWLIVGTIFAVGLGLIVAVLVDRVKIESVIKSTLFLPMALSATAAAVIWRFVYIYEPAGQTQIGLLNAFIGLFGIQPVAWFVNEVVNNFALIAIYVWGWTGFSMVILSAALKGIPDEIIEAAKIDGASRFTMFWRVMIPMIAPTLTVVTITMIINILKIFDVVYVNTGGNFHTSVIAQAFYDQMFTNQNLGLGSAWAVVLTLVILPVMIINLRRIRAEGRAR
jgi:alpha-glucoside transport system permease protein